MRIDMDNNSKDKQKQKQTRMRPKLERRNAHKNIDYDAPISSSSSSLLTSSFDDDSSSSTGQRTRSLDLPPFSRNQTSFRVEGTEGEFDLICRSLGLNGIDDFAIPTAAWEAQKARSASDLASRLRNQTSSSSPKPEQKPPPPSSSSSNLTKIQIQSRDRVRDSVTVGKEGINGVRPRILAPPPVMVRSVVDNLSSTWEILKSFAPLIDEDEDEDVVCSESNHNDYGIVNLSLSGKFRRSITSWQKGDLLGSGSFGTVYEGFTEDGFFFAVKEVSLLDQGSQGKQNILALEQEISLLSRFEHENIVRYLGTDKDDSKLYIFLELVTKGSLASLYGKYRLRDSQVSAYTRQILNGLMYLHKQKVIHRDIKCSNILVDASGSVKLADFGLAKTTKLNDIKSCKGTPFWMAPEVVNMQNRRYGLEADIWSLGCTVLEMLTRQHPYSHLEGMQALFMIGKGEPPLVPDSLSRDARDFILKCIQVNPKDRPTAAQLLDHPFVTRPQNSFGPASPHCNSVRS